MDQRGRVHHLVPDTEQTEHTKVGVAVHLPLSVLKLLPLQRNPDVCGWMGGGFEVNSDKTAAHISFLLYTYILVVFYPFYLQLIWYVYVLYML